MPASIALMATRNGRVIVLLKNLWISRRKMYIHAVQQIAPAGAANPMVRYLKEVRNRNPYNITNISNRQIISIDAINLDFFAVG